jgi:hypothetical protein|tara:strand:- start:975 stop:1190 length:216 start_codon:yes stop_codon:yes gene_type:complete
MPKAKVTVSKVSDKLTKVNENFSVYMYDNGFMLEVSGKDADGEYKSAKIMVATGEQLVALIAEVVEMERDS